MTEKPKPDEDEFKIISQPGTKLFTVRNGQSETKNLTRQQMIDMVNGWVKPS